MSPLAVDRRTRRHGRFAVAVVFGFAIAASVGCGPTTDRLRIRGEVTLDGTPVERGSIRFAPSDGSQSPAAGAMIRDGEFDVPQERGLPPGVYRLSISSPDREGPKVPYQAGPGHPTMMVPRDRIPLAYNLQSDKTIELEASGDNFFRFDIASDE